MDGIIPTPELLDKIDAAASEPDPTDAFLDGLRTRLRQKAVSQSVAAGKSRRNGLGIALTVVVLAVACVGIVGPEKVASVVRDALWFVPGFGVVHSESVRLLAEPVMVTRDGFTVSIDQLMADSEKTVLRFSIYSVYFSASLDAAEDPKGTIRCNSTPGLVLPDGTVIVPTHVGWGERSDGYTEFDEYPPLPPGVMDLTFALDCLTGMAPGAAPEAWKIPLRLTLGTNPTVMPVVQIGAPSSAGIPAATDSSGLSSTALMSVRLTGYSETAEGFVLIGSLRPMDPRFIPLPFLINQSVRIIDADGVEIPSEIAAISIENPAGGEMAPEIVWAVEIQGKSFHGPLVVKIDAVEGILKDPVRFSVDLGADPQPDQVWPLNRDLSILGYPLRLLSARYVVTQENSTMGMSGLEFTVRSAEEIEGFYVDGAEEGVGQGHFGDLMRQGRDTYTTGIIFSEPETGVVDLQVNRLRLKGAWSAAWNPPPIPGAPSPTPVPQACLTDSIWSAVRQEEVGPLPSGLTGRILVSRGELPEDMRLFLSDPDGSHPTDLAAGFVGSLSPDGKRAAVIDTSNRLRVVDAVSGNAVVLDDDSVATEVSWSPDGNWIAYINMSDDEQGVVMLIRPDGTGKRALDPGMKVWGLGGWSADSSALLAETTEGLQEAGFLLRMIDIDDGQSSPVLAGVVVDHAVISPDGTWVAYNRLEFGRRQDWVYVSRLDGSDRRLIVALESRWYPRNPVWSPDGRWIAVSIHDMAASPAEEPSAILIQPGTCAVAGMDGVKGAIRAWTG